MNIIKKNKQKNYLRNNDIYRPEKKSTLKQDVIISDRIIDTESRHIHFELDYDSGCIKCIYESNSYLRNIKFLIDSNNDLITYIAENNPISVTITDSNINLIY